MNGRPWTRPEIDRLCLIAANGGDIEELSAQLQRTPKAVLAKASRLQLKVPHPA